MYDDQEYEIEGLTLKGCPRKQIPTECFLLISMYYEVQQWGLGYANWMDAPAIYLDVIAVIKRAFIDIEGRGDAKSRS